VSWHGKSGRKLTAEQVLEVRLCYMLGDWEWCKLAKKFGVGPEVVKKAAQGVTYRDLPMPPNRTLSDRPFPYG
jgi:hypothetical protein